MNLLLEKAPDYIIVGGKRYNMRTDFALWVKYIIASENKDVDKLNEALFEIFGSAQIPKNDVESFVAYIYDWLTPPEEHTENAMKNKTPFDFEVDGNVIYSELWQYFPELMQKGISWHEGMELIKLLLHNDKTELHHRAYARTGDFTNLSKEQKKYWNDEKQRLKLPDKRTEDQKQYDFNSAMSALF